jgi:hypothetical protein
MLMALVLAATPFPAELLQPTRQKLERFTFPPPTAFAQTGAQQRTAHLVIQGRLQTPRRRISGFFEISPTDAGAWCYTLASADVAADNLPAFQVTSLDGDVWPGTWEREDIELVVEHRFSTPMAASEETALVYASTLFSSSGPLHNDVVGSDRGLVELVDRVRRTSSVSVWAQKNVHNDALYQRLRSYRPPGFCGTSRRRDPMPTVLLELAWARGELGHFIQLQTEWPRYGLAEPPARAPARPQALVRLEQTGVDVDQLLMGMLLETLETRARMSPLIFASTSRAFAKQESLRPHLVRLATSQTSDVRNRVNATQALVYLALPTVRENPTADELQQADTLLAEVAALPLHPAARAWFEMWRNTQSSHH